MIRNSKNATTPPRKTLRLNSIFVAPGDSSSASIRAYIEFQEILATARGLNLKRRQRELRERERNSITKAALISKVAKILQRHFADKISGEEAAKKIRTVCHDKQQLRELFDFFAEPASTSNVTAEQLREAKTDITRKEKKLRAWVQTSRQMAVLGEYAQVGDCDAIETLAKIGTDLVLLLMVVERTHPEAVRKVARSSMLWPFLASAKTGWKSDMVERIEKLELGKHLEVLHTRFQSARGADENYPARQWAKAAVRTIEETRLRHLLLREVRSEIEEIVFGGTVSFAQSPEWAAQACSLPMLSKAASREWGAIVRTMIREQLPEFHTRPEWKIQRNTGRLSGRNTRGELQNAILDDIVSALRRIAPERCRISSAESKQPKKEKRRSQV